MPKPLGQEPDVKPTHEVVRDLMRKAHTDRMAPIGITFSQRGYEKAQGETVPGMQAWGRSGSGEFVEAPTYLGLPFTIDNRSWADPVSLVLVPGGSPEAREFRASGRASVSMQPGPIRVTAKGPMDRPTVELLAEGLSLVQMSDLTSAWASANPGPFADALLSAVRAHGRFE
jgi:hypothetical protein